MQLVLQSFHDVECFISAMNLICNCIPVSYQCDHAIVFLNLNDIVVFLSIGHPHAHHLSIQMR